MAFLENYELPKLLYLSSSLKLIRFTLFCRTLNCCIPDAAKTIFTEIISTCQFLHRQKGTYYFRSRRNLKGGASLLLHGDTN